MRRTTLLALSLILVGIWSHHSASGQTSRTGMKKSPATSDRVSSTPATNELPRLPSPAAAADYDGFSAGMDDNDAPSQVAPPMRSRAATGSSRDTNGLDAQSSIDQEDEALKRKLTICKNCK